jgi:hypothetical protein
MGASSSIVYGEYVSREDLLLMYGDQFDEELYQQLQNPSNEGLVNVHQLEAIIEERNNEIKKQKLLEIQKTFKLYSPNGKMTSRNFVQYLRDAKLFKKNKFTIPDAEIVFQNMKSSQETVSSTLDCVGFISSLNILAEKIGIDRETLVTRLSRLEYEPETKRKGVHEKNGGRKAGADDGEEEANVNPDTEIKGDSTVDEKSQAAAIKLQQFSRGHVAKKKMNDAREVISFLLSSGSVSLSVSALSLVCLSLSLSLSVSLSVSALSLVCLSISLPHTFSLPPSLDVPLSLFRSHLLNVQLNFLQILSPIIFHKKHLIMLILKRNYLMSLQLFVQITK